MCCGGKCLLKGEAPPVCVVVGMNCRACCVVLGIGGGDSRSIAGTCMDGSGE